MNFQQAEDEMFGLLQATWLAAVALLVPAPAETPQIIWPGEAVPDPDSTILFCTPNLEVLTRPQKTLRSNTSGRLFESTALFSVSIFAPKSDADARRQAVALGMAIEKSVGKASPSGSIWFRNGKSSPANGTATQNQVNVVTTCVYQDQQ